ncbi:MAG: serine/threonine-protein kinase, partial [Planctomycetota bacterium]
IKVLRQPAAGADEAAVSAFLREARAAAALADPRLVAVFDLGQDAGRHFLSMELVRGGSLAARIRRDGPLPWRQALPILRDVAGALQLAHNAGLVHRDVKPANILLTGDHRAKLADLGLVRDLGGAGDRAGTAAFMAPEQLDGTSVDGRADLYALGCTAYAALVGRAPFVGTVREILKQKRAQQPAPFEAARGVPPGLDRLVRQQLLALDPAKRPPDAGEVIDELDRIERTGGGLATARRSQKRRPTRGGGGLWVALVVGLLLLGVAWVVWKQRAG